MLAYLTAFTHLPILLGCDSSSVADVFSLSPDTCFQSCHVYTGTPRISSPLLIIRSRAYGEYQVPTSQVDMLIYQSPYNKAIAV